MDSKNNNRIPLWINAVFCTLFTLLLGGLLYFVVVNVSFFNPFQKAFRDFEFTDLYYSKSLEENQISDKIILVNVQKANRLEIAQAIENVAKQNPRTIALDLIFRELKEKKSDSVLKATLQKHLVISAFYKENDSLVFSHPYFELDQKNAGFINLYPKKDQTVIRDYLGTQDSLYSFASKVALQYDKNLSSKIHKFDKLFPIDYTANLDNFFVFDFDELSENESVSVMQDAIVIFGYLGTPTGNEFDIEDKHFTPLNPEIAGKSAPDMYGVVVHANVVKMLVSDNFLFKVSDFWTYFLAFLTSVIMTYFGMKIERNKSFFKDFLKKGVPLLFSIFLIYLALVLLKSGILIHVTPILVLSIFSVSMIKPYQKTLDYLKKKLR